MKGQYHAERRWKPSVGREPRFFFVSIVSPKQWSDDRGWKDRMVKHEFPVVLCETLADYTQYGSVMNTISI